MQPATATSTPRAGISDAALKLAEQMIREFPETFGNGRWPTLRRFAAEMAGRGYDGEDVIDATEYANEQLCHPPLAPEQVHVAIAAGVGHIELPDEKIRQLLPQPEPEPEKIVYVMDSGPALAEPDAKTKPALLKLTEITLTGGQGGLVANLLNQGEISAIIGAPGSGKSYAAGGLAYCVATGQSWLGRFTARGPAVYLAAERGIEQAKRLRAWCAADNVDPDTLPLRIINGMVNMLSTKAAEALAEQINQFASEAGEPVKLIVIDTIPATMPGHDLNDSSKATQYAEHVKRLASATGAAVMCVHHTPKDGRSTGLGSVQFDALFDGILRIESGAQGKHGTLRLVKCNTIASPEWEIRWASETVEADIDGAPVIVSRFVPTAQREGREAPRGQAGIALEVLANLTLSGQGVSLDTWRDACRDKLSKPNATRQARDAAFNRAVEKLTDRVANEDGRYRPAAE